MTKEQIELARHALGLDGRRTCSYRNYFTCSADHKDWDEWQRMTMEGHAKYYLAKRLHLGGDDLFKLTLKGAKAALLPGETLDKEDFTATEAM